MNGFQKNLVFCLFYWCMRACFPESLWDTSITILLRVSELFLTLAELFLSKFLGKNSFSLLIYIYLKYFM